MIALPAGEVAGVLVLPIAVAVGAVIGWLALLSFVLMATRPRAGRAAAATQDLGGDEPPAVVSFVTSGWKVTEDAVESTLLDLAARDHLEFRQLSDEPRATTVHLVDPARRPPAAAPLTPYEQSVLGRVAAVAVDGMAPVTALTFRNEGAAQNWWSGFEKAVAADARSRGLSRRRVSPGLVAALSAVAAAPGLAVFGAVLAQRQHDFAAAAGAGFVTFFLLSGFAARPWGERETPLGREVAGRWLGLRRYLAVDEAFRDLPPASVAVWDRYLAYGDALGMTRVCAAVLDLGLGDRELVWSSYGGTWHRVKVRYPSASARFGGTVPRLLGGAVPALAVSFVASSIGGGPGLGGAAHTISKALSDDAAAGHRDPLAFLLVAFLLLGAGTLAWAVQRVVRTVLGALSPITFEGEVLWVSVARYASRGSRDVPIPVVYYLAVDDGASTSKGYRTTAWALSADMSSSCTPGDVVAVTARRYSRRVTTVEVRSHRSVDAVVIPAGAGVTSPSTGDVPAAAAAAVGVAPAAVRALHGLVATALGAAVGEVGTRGTGSPATPGVVFDVSDHAQTVPAVTLASAHGTEGEFLLAASRSGGEAMRGIGDEAWSGPGWAVARRGDLTVRLSLSPQVRDRGEQHLPVLLASAMDALAPSNDRVSTRD